jgi:capsular polysaccharide biosynthesis protein
LRDSSAAYYRHADPAYILPDELKRVREIAGKSFYLGHVFEHYGHFLMETFPMLSIPIQMRRAGPRFTFLPFWKSTEHKLIFRFLDLLGLDQSSLLIHDTEDVLVGDFFVPTRPIVINSGTGDVEPYRHVIREIKNRIGIGNSKKASRRVFLGREPSRADANYALYAEECFSNAGFEIVRPEQLTIEQQIVLMHQSTVIAGFAGSALHNSMFASPGSLVIELGDERSPIQNTSNQIVCQAIARSRSAFIPYTPSQPSSLHTIVSNLSKFARGNRWISSLQRQLCDWRGLGVSKQ